MIIAVELAAGLVLLFVGAELLVRGAAGIASRLGVSPMIIGLTVVAYGTTAPELLVSVEAALEDAPALALGNIVGSNTANILLNCSIAGLIAPLVCSRAALRVEGMMMLGAGAIFVLLSFYGILHWWIGVVMLILLVASTLGVYQRDRRSRRDAVRADEIEEIATTANWSWLAMIGAFAVGLAGILFGADYLVSGATDLARAAGISEAVIGLTLVAVGTSLPELATAVVAAMRGHTAIAVGNVLGANVYNILGITGVVALFGPYRIPESIIAYDQWVMIGAMVLMLLAFRVYGAITRPVAMVMLVLYAGYVASLFLGISGMGDIMVHASGR